MPKTPKSVAFVTYNSVGEGLSSGWHESNGRRALVVQNTKCARWAGPGPLATAFLYMMDDVVGREATRDADRQAHDARRGEIGNVWTELQKSLPELDHVVVYVGTGGSEHAIELASKLPAHQVSFVLCDCNLRRKTAMIAEAGLSDAGVVLCECGGHRTMKLLFQDFMATGELPSVLARA